MSLTLVALVLIFALPPPPPAATATVAVAVTIANQVKCPDGYHIEEREGQGTGRCFVDLTCEVPYYLNTNDKCVSNVFCADNPKAPDCMTREKPKVLDIDCDMNPDQSYFHIL